MARTERTKMGSGKERGPSMPTWNKPIKEGGEHAMKQMKFRVKVHGRISFVFSECQMRPKIRACEATFSPSTEIWQKVSPAIQPNALDVCPALTKRRHARASRRLPGLAWPWLFLEGQVPALPKLRVPPGTAFIPQLHCGNEQWQLDVMSWAWGSEGTPHPQVSGALLQLFTQQIFCFQPRPEHVEEGRVERSGFCLL